MNALGSKFIYSRNNKGNSLIPYALRIIGDENELQNIIDGKSDKFISTSGPAFIWTTDSYFIATSELSNIKKSFSSYKDRDFQILEITNYYLWDEIINHLQSKL